MCVSAWQPTNNNLGFVRQMLAPILMKRLPFASTYGNHDLSRVLPRASIFRLDQSMPRSYTQQQTPATTAGTLDFCTVYDCKVYSCTTIEFAFVQ